MKVAYIRVSTEEQNTARQQEAMKALGVEKIFIEKISGKNLNRPQLKAMMEYVREGDCLYVESYSRLARSTQDLLSIIEKLTEKKVAFISLKENIDTTTPQGKFMLTVFAGLAEFERTCLLQRQREGIECAKAEGKYKGRKPVEKPENFDEVIKLWKDGEITARRAMQKLNLTASTFYRMVK
ncbi:MAG: recombinase family protein [Sphaerochaetaceae bacterium]|nr:recombinase family protein [Sphaerochaetaceae bacterium]